MIVEQKSNIVILAEYEDIIEDLLLQSRFKWCPNECLSICWM